MRTGVRMMRVALFVVGLLVGLYGVLRLLGLGWSNLIATAPWLAGVVVAHDAVLAPLVLLTASAAARILPGWSRGPAVGALVVLGSVALPPVTTPGRFGAKADNATLLDRPYAAGWLVFAGLVLGWAALVAARGRRKGAPHG